MAGSSVDLSHGVAFVLGTSSWVLEVLTASWDDITREAIETTQIAQAAAGASKFGNATFIASDIVDGGTLTLTGHFHTGQTVTTQQPPIGLVAETGTFTFPKTTGDSTAATWAATMFCTNVGVSFDGPNGKVIVTTSWKVTGNVTVVAAA